MGLLKNQQPHFFIVVFYNYLLNNPNFSVSEITLVVHVLLLADRALYRARILDVDVWLDAYHRNDAVVQWFDERHLLRWVWREVLCIQLYVEVEGIFVVLAVHSDEVVRAECWELRQTSLYLSWEHVHTTDNHHVV